MKWLIILVGAAVAWKTGVLNKLGLPLPVTLYTLTDADVEQIASHYSDGRSSFRVGGMTLGDAIRQAIRTHRIAAYNTDSYCGWSNQSPANPAGTDGVAAMASGTVVTSASIASSITKQLTNTATQSTSGIVGGIAKALPIIAIFATVATAIFGFLSAHHAARVAQENKILCPLIPALDGQWTAIDSAMSSGKMDGATAKQAVLTVQSGAHSAIDQDRSSGALNAIGQQVDAVTEAYDLIIQQSGI